MLLLSVWCLDLELLQWTSMDDGCPVMWVQLQVLITMARMIMSLHSVLSLMIVWWILSWVFNVLSIKTEGICTNGLIDATKR